MLRFHFVSVVPEAEKILKKDNEMLKQHMAFILLMLVLFSCQAGMPVEQNKDLQLDTKYTWFDGDRQREVWLNPEEIAEFSGYELQQSIGIKRRSLKDGAVLLKRYGDLRIWLIPPEESPAVLRKLKRQYDSVGYSPVFHVSRAAYSPRMALPGNIIVAFYENWDLQQAAKWLAKKKLEILKPVIESQGIFLVKSESGLASLRLANELSKAREVRYAMPDWWRETFRR